MTEEFSEYYINIGLKVSYFRKKAGMTQEQLAEKADITPEYLARIESEKYNPSLVVIVNLALALDVSIEKLIPIN